MDYIITTEHLLSKFIGNLTVSPNSRNTAPFVDYVLKCYEEGRDVDWDVIDRHVSRYKLRQLRYAERCINIAYHKHFDAMPFVTETFTLTRKKLIP